MELHAISPLDGRYLEAVAPLQDHFSEFAYLRARVKIEVEYLQALLKLGIIPGQSDSETFQLGPFTDADAHEVQQYEKITRHDVKAIEYYLRTRLPPSLHSWIHFGLTSEDVNNLAQAIALRESRDAIILPALRELMMTLCAFAIKYRSTPMLARTHGQPAVPTTLGKEIAVAIARIHSSLVEIGGHRFQAKLTGAVGNFNALRAAAPHLDWVKFSKDFVQGLGLEPNLGTTQILPYDNWIRYFQEIQILNAALIDYAQDIWRYISDGYLKQTTVDTEVGSSTMPQKVNPIDFENAEGNLGIANALFSHYAQKLPISRLQRDLSDSTIRRTFGVAFGHSLVAWRNIIKGMSRLAADEDRMLSDLDSHWEVVSEGAQTILRLAGRRDAYESLKTRIRGQNLTQADYDTWLDSLDVDDHIRQQLAALSPRSYIGFAVELTDTITTEAVNTRIKA